MTPGRSRGSPHRARSRKRRHELAGHCSYVLVGDASLATVYDEQWDGNRLPELSPQMGYASWGALVGATFDIDAHP